MKKLFLLALIILVMVSLLMSGCKKQISDEELKAELNKLSDEELNQVVKDAESSKPLAGQAVYATKLSTSVATATNSQLLKIVSDIKLERVLVSLPTCAPAPSGLVSWWKADNVSGTMVLDAKGGNNGVLTNGAAIVPGKVGKAFSFDGVDDYIKVNMPNTYSQMTVEAWVKLGDPQPTYDTPVIISQYGPVSWKLTAEPLWTSEVKNVGFEFDDGNVLRIVRAGLSESTPVGEVVPLLNQLEWRHLAVVVSNGQFWIYLDGKAMNIYDLKVSDSEAEGFIPVISIGSSADVVEQTSIGFKPFKGFVDEVSLYNRALSASEIQVIYNAGATGKCSPTILKPVIKALPQN